MDGIRNLLVNNEVIGNVVGAFLAFMLGSLATFLVQRRAEKSNKVEIRYSKKTEVPLKIVKDELRNALRVYYNGTEVEDLYVSTVRLANTGRRTIKNQTFTCMFPDGTRAVDPAPPKITTTPAREVGPVHRDQSIAFENEYRYTIEVLGVGQIVQIAFLTVGNSSEDLQVMFRPNDEQEVDFVEGSVSGSPTLESHIQNILVGIGSFFVLVELGSFLPFFGRALGAVFGLPLLFMGARSLRSIVPQIAEVLQVSQETRSIQISGEVDSLVIDNMGTVHSYSSIPQCVQEESE